MILVKRSTRIVSNISNEELAEAVKELEPDETVDILQNLPEDRMNTILSKCLKDRKRIEIGLTYLKTLLEVF